VPFAQHCGHCDNCLRAPVVPAIEVPDLLHVAQAAKMPEPLFKPGDAVKVPRYGDGLVARSAGDEVTVTFADGVERTFMASYVKGPRAVRKPRKRAPPKIEPQAAVA
jgi:ATP-dependent DNA helicase RecQ